MLLREGRASVQARPARNTLEFAEAAASLGVDRGIKRFVRYSLLKRRGDSYVALPAGTFTTGYRSNSDCIREFLTLLEKFTELPKSAEELRRNVEEAVYRALLTDKPDEIRTMMAALGRMVRRALTAAEVRLPKSTLDAALWLRVCGFDDSPDVRIAAALASLYDKEVGSIRENLLRGSKTFAWDGISLAHRMASVLNRRIQSGNAAENRRNPLGGVCPIDAGDVTFFLDGSVDDDLIEDLLFAFLLLDWKGFKPAHHVAAEVLPVYAVLKCLFLAGEIKHGEESQFLVADRRILAALSAGEVEEATELAVNRLRIAGLRPLQVQYRGGIESSRLAGCLLIPVRIRLKGC